MPAPRRRRVAVAVACGLLLLRACAICGDAPPPGNETRSSAPSLSPSLSLYDSDGAEIFSAPAAPGERFSIIFRHSLMLSTVEEVFATKAGGGFRLVETRYEDFGAGLPYEEMPGQTMRFENGKIILDGYTAEFTDLWLRVGHIADHRLVTPAGETIHLNTLFPPGSAVRVIFE